LNCGILFILFWKRILGICFDKERNKMAENKIIKQNTAIIFDEFRL
jgi:hypothetical protein